MSEPSGEKPNSADAMTTRPVDLATRLFREVSIKYSGLETAQAISLAMKCQQLNLNPYLLGQSLLNDHTQIEELTIQANNAHRKRNEKTDSNPEIPSIPPVTPNTTAEIVGTVFSLADAMRNLDPVLLQQLLDGYPEAMKESKNAYRIKVLDTIHPLTLDNPRAEKAIERVRQGIEEAKQSREKLENDLAAIRERSRAARNHLRY